MIIHFDNVNFNSTSGPNTFANRLAKVLYSKGHQIISHIVYYKPDVSLVFIQPTGAKLASKVVQRLDGIWFKPNEFYTKNSPIKALYEQANTVIWQSEFDCNMTKHWWGTPNNGVIIHNGIEINNSVKITNKQIQNLRDKYQKIFVCSANWHPQKRLKSNINLYQIINSKYKNSKNCLIVLGKNPDFIPNSYGYEDIFFAGSVSEDIYIQIYSIADWGIHLAWADHSPNTVCEMLSQKMPIICSSVGGTKELVGNYGLVLNDPPYNYELYDYDNPPILDLKQFSLLPDKSSLDYASIADIDINNVAKKYIEVFESC